MTIDELRKNKIAIAAIQETRCTKSTPHTFANNVYNIYTSHLTNKYGFGTVFFVDSKVKHLVTKFAPINERICICYWD
jgi:hypothetical protein